MDARVMASDDIAVLVLAAGRSQRFGSDKRIAQLPGRGTLLAATLATLRPYFSEIRVVIGEGDDAETLGIPNDIVTLVNREADRGMGTSLAVGMRIMSHESQASVAAIMLGDMPWIRNATFEALMQQAGEALIVRPTFQGQGGHPVMFGRRFWPVLCRLDGDAGARHLLRDHPGSCIDVATADPGVLKDVDEPSALTSG